MARIRTIKPQFFDDRKIGHVSRDARLVLILLWYLADAQNKSIYTLNYLKDKTNLYRYGKKTHERVIRELSDNGLVEILDLESCFNATATEQWQDNVVYETNLHKNARYSKGCLDVILFSC